MNATFTTTRENLTARAILNTPRGAQKGQPGTPRQGNLIKQELHNQMVRLRDAFLREDPRITGSIPRYLVAATLKAGGMELPKDQLENAKRSYTTGDARFNWMLFCDKVELARKQSWGEASRLKSAKLFNEIDKDGSGRLGRDELAQAVQRLGIKVPRDELESMFDSFDEDGDGNLSYPEFVDGFATNIIAPSPVFQRVLGSSRGPKKIGSLTVQRTAAKRT